jgi:hypothetical protein
MTCSCASSYIQKSGSRNRLTNFSTSNGVTKFSTSNPLEKFSQNWCTSIYLAAAASYCLANSSQNYSLSLERRDQHIIMTRSACFYAIIDSICLLHRETPPIFFFRNAEKYAHLSMNRENSCSKGHEAHKKRSTSDERPAAKIFAPKRPTRRPRRHPSANTI